MSPAQSAMIMRKLEAMEGELGRVKGQLRAERAANNELHETVDMQSRRIETISAENRYIGKVIESSSTMVVQLIRKVARG